MRLGSLVILGCVVVFGCGRAGPDGNNKRVAEVRVDEEDFAEQARQDAIRHKKRLDDFWKEDRSDLAAENSTTQVFNAPKGDSIEKQTSPLVTDRKGEVGGASRNAPVRANGTESDLVRKAENWLAKSDLYDELENAKGDSGRLLRRIEALEKALAERDQELKRVNEALAKQTGAVTQLTRELAMARGARAQQNRVQQPPERRRFTLADLEGAIIIADDGTFLGKITSNDLDPKGIMNDVGTYGSNVSASSIFNDVGRFGGDISAMSPWNDIASKPPTIYLDREFVAYLTVNELKEPRIDPRALIGFLRSRR
jgi:hypothetical protein